MEIKIDTRRDSEKEIKEAIKLLKSLLENNDISDYDSPSEGTFNMFGGSDGNLFDEDEENDDDSDDVQIMPYDV